MIKILIVIIYIIILFIVNKLFPNYFISQKVYNDKIVKENKKNPNSTLIIGLLMFAICVILYYFKDIIDKDYIPNIVWFSLIYLLGNMSAIMISTFIVTNILPKCQLMKEINRFFINCFYFTLLILLPLSIIVKFYEKTMKKESTWMGVFGFYTLPFIFNIFFYFFVSIFNFKLPKLIAMCCTLVLFIGCYLITFLIIKCQNKNTFNTLEIDLNEIIFIYTGLFYTIGYVYFIIFFLVFNDNFYNVEILNIIDNIYKLFTVAWLFVSLTNSFSINGNIDKNENNDD